MTSNVPAIIRWDQAYNRNGDEKLPRTVVNALRTHMNNHTLEGWVKAETLADYTGMTVRGVRKQIAANVKAGWIEIVQSGNSSGLANTYRLTCPKGELQDTVRVNHRTVKGEPQFTPTTPITSPVTTPKTSPEKGEPQFTLGTTDPFGSGGVITPAESTTELEGEPQFTLAEREPQDTVGYFTDLDSVIPSGVADSGDPRDPFSSAFVPRGPE